MEVEGAAEMKHSCYQHPGCNVKFKGDACPICASEKTNVDGTISTEDAAKLSGAAMQIGWSVMGLVRGGIAKLAMFATSENALPKGAAILVKQYEAGLAFAEAVFNKSGLILPSGPRIG